MKQEREELYVIAVISVVVISVCFIQCLIADEYTKSIFRTILIIAGTILPIVLYNLYKK